MKKNTKTGSTTIMNVSIASFFKTLNRKLSSSRRRTKQIKTKTKSPVFKSIKHFQTNTKPFMRRSLNNKPFMRRSPNTKPIVRRSVVKVTSKRKPKTMSVKKTKKHVKKKKQKYRTLKSIYTNTNQKK